MKIQIKAQNLCILHIYQRRPVGRIEVFAGLILAPSLMFDTPVPQRRPAESV